MRTSELERFQSHRRKSPFRSRSRRAAYMRRWWWKQKLRKMGVPEIDLDETVDRMLVFREKQCWYLRNPGKGSELTMNWIRKHPRKVREYRKKYKENRQRAERQKMLMAIGG